MKRVFSFIIALLLIALSFCGCHGSRDINTFEVPSSFDKTKNYELTFWAKNDTNKTQTKIYEKAISDFETLYPNVKINLRLYTDYSRIYNDVITNIATKTTPDICITYPDHIATYLTGNDIVVPLDSLITDKKYGLGGSETGFDSVMKEEIIPEFLDECIFDGHYYALPFMRSTEACYINKTYVEKLGYTVPDILTWDFIWEVSEAAAKKNPDGTFAINGQKVMIPFIYKSTDNMMIQMLFQQDAGYSDVNGNIEIFNDTTKELLFKIADETKKGAFSTFKISSYPANYLNAGQCIFAIDSTAGATWMGSDAPLLDISEESVVDFETVVRAVPQFDTDNPKMISQGPSVCIFNKDDPQQVLASWLFTQFLLTDGIQASYSETEGYVPVTSKVRASEEYKEYLSKCGEDNNLHYDIKIKATKLLLDNTENTFTTPVFNGSASLRDAAGQMIENVVKSVNRRENVNEEYMNKLYKDITSLYKLDDIGGNGDSSQSGKKDFGKLPAASVVLLVSICTVWVLILIFVTVSLIKKKKAAENKE